MTTPKQTIPALRIPCLDADHAEKLATYLRTDEQLDINGVEGNEVLIPWGGSPGFAFAVFDVAFELGHVADDLSPVVAQIPNAR